MQLTIEKLIYGGDGLARLPPDDQGRGKAVFIPFVLEGENVNVALLEQKPGFARGSTGEITSPSQHRVPAPCPYFTRCGGCHYQHSSYPHQLEIKTAILRENLRRIAKLELDIDLQVHSAAEWNYRNRSRFTVQHEPAFALCYHKFNSNELLPVEQCPISSPLINRALQQLWEAGRATEFPPQIKEIEIFADAKDENLLLEVYCSEDASEPLIEEWMKDIQTKLGEAIGIVAFKSRGSRNSLHSVEEFASVGQKDISYETARKSYRVSAGSFFQINRHLMDTFVNLVTNGASGGTALDLYAGVGLFSSVLNRDFQRVIAVESSPTSYSDLGYNSAPNVKAVHSTTEEYLKRSLKKLQPELIVLDPPRAGLNEAIVRSLTEMNAPRITYVSCDPATVARDLRGLLNSGFRLREAHLIDLFPQTFHIESVFHLER